MNRYKSFQPLAHSKSLRQAKQRPKLILNAESLEDRRLLSVASSLAGDQLNIQIVPDDDRLTAYIRKDGSNIDVADNASFSGAVSYQAAQVSSVSVSGTVTNDALVLTGGSIAASLVTSLVDSVSFTGGGSFGGSIGIGATAAGTSLANLFSTGGLITTTASASPILLSGQVVAAQGVSFNAPVVLQTDVSIDGGSGSVLFNSTVDAATAGGQSLLVTSPASTQFVGAAGGKTALKNLTTQSVTPLDAPILAGRSTTVPIYYLPQADGSSVPGIKYGIEVAIGDKNPAQMYLFDTGGTAFWAAYTENTVNGVTVTDQTVQNLYTSGLFYNGNVTSANVTIGTGPNAVSTSRPVQLATWKQGGNTFTPDNWFFPPQNNQTGTLYGDFGAAFGIDNTVANSPLTSILFQLPGSYSSGYTVRLGAVGGPACLTIGITEEQRQQFPYAIPLTALANTTYPVSNLQAYEDFAFAPNYLISNGTLTYDLGNLPTISDTGAPSTSVRYPYTPPGFPANFPFTDVSGNIEPGTILSAALPTQAGYPALTWTQLIGNQQSVNKAGYMDRTGAATNVNNVNTGLNLFNQYDVMFDVEKGLIRLRPNAGIGTVTIGSVTTTGDQNFTQNVNLGGTAKSTAGSITIGGKAYLTGDVSLRTADRPITFQNTIDGDNSLDIQTSDTVTFGSNVGVYEKLRQITVSAGKTVMPLVSAPTVATYGPQSYSGETRLNGTVQSSDKEIVFSGQVTLVGPASVISDKSEITFKSRVDGAQPLSLTAASNITLQDKVGDKSPVAGLNVNATLFQALDKIKLDGTAANAQPDGLVVNPGTTVRLNVSGSEIRGFQGNGLLFKGQSRQSAISGLTISGNVNNGIRFSSPNAATADFSGTVIAGNKIFGNNGFGVEFSNPVTGLLLSNNTIGQAGNVNPWGFVNDGGNTHGIVIGPGDYRGSEITLNSVVNNRRDGIFAPAGVTSLSITQNNISTNGAHGIDFFTGDFTGTVITDNTISDNVQDGISLGAGIIPAISGGNPQSGYTGSQADSGHYVLNYSTSPLVDGLVKNDPKIALDCPIFNGGNNSTTVEIPLDTGSRGLYLAIPMVNPGTDLGQNKGYVYLNSSNRIFYGNWVSQTVTFSDSEYIDSQNVADPGRKARANLPILVVTAIGATTAPAPGSTSADCTFSTTIESGEVKITNGAETKSIPIVNGVITIPGGWWANYADNKTSEGNDKLPNVCNFGIGFDRSGQGTYPTDNSVNQGYNAFLNLTEMQSGVMRAGYVITPQNIILGLDRSISDYSYTDLAPTGNAQAASSPPDWQPATGRLTYGNLTYSTGPIVIDMGISSGIITLPGQSVTSPFGQQLTVDLLNSGGELAYNINYNNANNLLNPSSVAFFNPLAGNYSENAPQQNNQFFNTGRYVFSGFDYLYDATGGYLGLKPNNKSVLDLANATYPASGKHFANPNAPSGVTNLTIGGDFGSSGNTISNNHDNGIYINGSGSTGNRLAGNVIIGNGKAGIKLAGDANQGQQAPVLNAQAGYAENQLLYIGGTMPTDEKYNGNYVIQFFAGHANNTGQPADARVLLGTIVQPAGDFYVSFPATAALFGSVVTATATPQAGPQNTSEFSAGAAISTVLVTSSADSGPCTLRNAIAFANQYDFRKTITFQLPADDHTIQLKSQLPALATQTEIDGRNHNSKGEYFDNAWLDGSRLGKNTSGLRVEPAAAGSLIRSLGFRSFRRGNAISVRASDLAVRDNRFHEGLVAISLNNAARARVENNDITRFGQGVLARGDLAGGLIDGNQINYSTYAGIRLENATNLTVGVPGLGNNICGTEKRVAQAAGIYATGQLGGTIIQGNRIQSGGNGIFMKNARGLQVGGSAITPLVGGNSIFNNSGIGLYATGNSSGSAVRGNSITGNRRDVAIATARNLQYTPGPAYVSPFKVPLDSRITDWASDLPARSQLIMQNSQPGVADWYSFNYNNQAYGPLNPQLMTATPAQSQGLNPAIDRGQVVNNVPLNQPPAGVDNLYWQRQRLLAAAVSLIGTPYQHLHLPQFNPANVTGSQFPWSSVSQNSTLQTSAMLLANTFNPALPNPYLATYGKPTEGIDCTDFAAYIYNLALGIQMYSGTPTQITFTLNGQPSGPVKNSTPKATVLASDGSTINPGFILADNFGTGNYNQPGSLDNVIAKLQPGDLLYIGDSNQVFHVVMWLGINGTDSAGNTFPLVISSHDNTPAIFDTAAVDPVTGFPTDNNIQGHLPPPGVQILPFVASNWFYQDFIVAMRVLKS